MLAPVCESKDESAAQPRFFAERDTKRMNSTQTTRTAKPIPIAPPYVHPFDREHGVDTSGLIGGRHLAVGHKHDRHNTAYYGVAPSLFRELCGLWRETKPPHALENYSFVDFGAGKGRAMMLASEFPFREVVGIELNTKLVDVAERNLERWQSTHPTHCPMRVLTLEATEYQFPANPCLMYLFNPFTAPVLRRVLKRAAGSFANRVGELDMLYVNHECESVLKKHAGFAQMWSGTIRMSPEDAAAEYAIIHSEGEGEYATTGDEVCSIYRWTGATAAD